MGDLKKNAVPSVRRWFLESAGRDICSQLGCNVPVSEATPGTNKQQPQTDEKKKKSNERTEEKRKKEKVSSSNLFIFP